MYRGATRSLSLAVTSFRTYFLPNAATQKRFGTLRLLVFNTAVSGTLYTIGDVIQQKIFGIVGSPYDYARTARMCALGVCMGPINHFWYLQLDRLVLGSGMTVVVKKIICDQLMFAPSCISVFYLGMNFLEGKNWTQGKRELQEKFLPSYKADWIVWPTAQMINFYFIPGYLRVTYVNVVTLAWTTTLSYLKHRDQHNRKTSHVSATLNT